MLVTVLTKTKDVMFTHVHCLRVVLFCTVLLILYLLIASKYYIKLIFILLNAVNCFPYMLQLTVDVYLFQQLKYSNIVVTT